jgi:hypothetical protein
MATIIEAWRHAGAEVLILSGAGHGAPDALVGWRGRAILCEIKNPNGRNRLSPEQANFLNGWPGETAVIRTVDEALALLRGRATGGDGLGSVEGGEET